MALVTVLVTGVITLVLGVWLGAMVFFSFIAAPRVFAVLGEEQAGRVVTDIFPRYYGFGVVLGLIGFAGGLVHGVLGGFGLRLGLVFFLVLVAVALTGYARWGLLPKMDAAGEDAFDRYHRQSVMLNGGTMLAVAGALLGIHFV